MTLEQFIVELVGPPDLGDRSLAALVAELQVEVRLRARQVCERHAVAVRVIVKR